MVDRAEIQAQVDELMRRYAEEEIDQETYGRLMMELTTSVRDDDA